MTKFAKPEKQAAQIVRQSLTLGQPRHGSDSPGVSAVGSARNYQSALKLAGEWGRGNGCRSLEDWSEKTAQKYLAERSEEVGQKALNIDRTALLLLPKVENLPRTKSSYESERKLAEEGRAYSQTQIASIVNRQNSKNGLSTEIASAAGLRAHELLTLRPSSEQPASGHRQWRDERFENMVGERYTVVGKGGLIREVVIPTPLAERLEAVRLAGSVTVTDRGVHYQTSYALAGGNSWSASFTRASQRAVEFSAGAHGLRHGYAQRRMDSLQRHGQPYQSALEIVSQELGHFRRDITLVYLR